MKIEELKTNHLKWVGKMLCSEKIAEHHTKLSINFALELLEELYENTGTADCYCDIRIDNKISELKNYYK